MVHELVGKALQAVDDVDLGELEGKKKDKMRKVLEALAQDMKKKNRTLHLELFFYSAPLSSTENRNTESTSL